MNPQCLLVRVGVPNVGKSVGEFKSDRMVASVSEFVVADGGYTIQFAEDGSEGIVTLGSLLYVSERMVCL